MKDGEIILHDNVSDILRMMEGKVWSVTLPTKEAMALSSKHVVVKSHHVHNEMKLRIVSETQPHAYAIMEEADLDDLYVYYFKEGDTL